MFGFVYPDDPLHYRSLLRPSLSALLPLFGYVHPYLFLLCSVRVPKEAELWDVLSYLQDLFFWSVFQYCCLVASSIWLCGSFGWLSSPCFYTIFRTECDATIHHPFPLCMPVQRSCLCQSTPCRLGHTSKYICTADLRISTFIYFYFLFFILFVVEENTADMCVSEHFRSHLFAHILQVMTVFYACFCPLVLLFLGIVDVTSLAGRTAFDPFSVAMSSLTAISLFA